MDTTTSMKVLKLIYSGRHTRSYTIESNTYTESSLQVHKWTQHSLSTYSIALDYIRLEGVLAETLWPDQILNFWVSLQQYRINTSDNNIYNFYANAYHKETFSWWQTCTEPHLMGMEKEFLNFLRYILYLLSYFCNTVFCNNQQSTLMPTYLQ